jgi:hypothetical protein
MHWCFDCQMSSSTNLWRPNRHGCLFYLNSRKIALRRSHCISTSTIFRNRECRPIDIGGVAWTVLRVDLVGNVICRMYGSKCQGSSIFNTPHIHVPHSSYSKANSYSCSF